MLSRIEAINSLLEVLGEGPVNSELSGHPLAARAGTKLDSTTKAILSAGWDINTEPGVYLALNTDGWAVVPTDALRVIPSRAILREKPTVRHTPAGGRALFRLADRSWVWRSPPEVTLIRLLPFEDLTPELQRAIQNVAGWEFQQASRGSVVLNSFSEQRAVEAIAAAVDAEAELSGANVLHDNPLSLYTTYRNSPLWNL